MLRSRTGQMSSNELEFQLHEGRRMELLVLITSTRTFKQLFLILHPFAFSFEACKWNFFCFYIIKFQMFVDMRRLKKSLSQKFHGGNFFLSSLSLKCYLNKLYVRKKYLHISSVSKSHKISGAT